MDAERFNALRTLTRNSYEDPRVVTRYVRLGLWPSEESLVADYVPDQARILDLGCGAGRVAVPLAEMGLDVVGVDLSAGMVAAAREQARHACTAPGRVQFDVGDATQLAFEDACFDAAIFAYNGIELVPGLQGKSKVLAEVYRILRPGGHFIFCAHSLYALNRHAPMRLRAFLRWMGGVLFGWGVRERELGERFIDDEIEEAPYLHLLSPRRWCRLLRQAGFEVLLLNSRQRIETGRGPASLTPFEDGERFFVARKGAPATVAGKRRSGLSSTSADINRDRGPAASSGRP